MSKWIKRIDLLLVFIITLITASGCFEDNNTPSKTSKTLELVSMPSTSTIRFMDEGLYIGYLGAQRDFALIVDNAGYTLEHQTQNCGIEGASGNTVGCASTMAKLVMSFGIGTYHFTGESGNQNVLIYYVSSHEFDLFGSPANDSWYDYMTADEQSEFKDDDTINALSCGTYASHHSICNISKELSERGYSKAVGNSMLILFENGSIADVITDKEIDPDGEMDNGTTNIDVLDMTYFEGSRKPLLDSYYSSIITHLSKQVRVSNATNVYATNSGSEQRPKVLNTLQEVEDLIAGKKGVGEFLLLIVSDGFISPKIGTNFYYDEDGVEREMSSTEGMNETQKSAMLLLNSVSTYTDNCAVESEPMLNFLKSILRAFLSGTIGALSGAALFAGAGALVGSVIPGIGTAIGAGVGAIVGAIAGFFAGLAINKKLEKKLKSANGISDKSYCKIVESALNGIQINVPIYSYKIQGAEKNIAAYKTGSMTDNKLKTFYNNNKTKCLSQYKEVAVPSGLMSFLTDDLDDKYAYADTCQRELLDGIVGGFGGAPSLQLYLQNKKADDLYGRLTSELVNEMMNVWGLKTVGDLYALSATSTRDKMWISFGSAQKIYNPQYCVSENKTPDCAGLSKNSITLSEDYLYTLEASEGTELDFTGEYKSFSREKTREEFTESLINSLNFNITKDNFNGYGYYTKTSGTWDKVEVKGLSAEESNVTPILDEIKNTLKEQIVSDSTNTYQLGYNDVNYILCENGDVIGYIKSESGEIYEIVYYYNGETEYVFDDFGVNGKKNDGSSFVSENYYTREAYNDSETQIESAHDFFVYIEYFLEGKSEPSYYTYVI